MPKKLGTNPKALEARSKKEEKKRAEQEHVEKLKEDALWADDDKQLARKQNRKEDVEKKKAEVAARKAANKAAYEEEMGKESMARASAAPAPTKVTRAEIQTTIERQQSETGRQKEKEKREEIEPIIVENLNRLQVDGAVASTVEEAIHILGNGKEDIDLHPERRLKAAYAAFEDANLPRLKAENPNLRLSQLKQMLRKDWIKSPSNPLNQQ